MSDIRFSKSPEEVALMLYEKIHTAEEANLEPGKKNREYILSTYTECLETVRGGKSKAEPKIRSA